MDFYFIDFASVFVAVIFVFQAVFLLLCLIMATSLVIKMVAILWIHNWLE